HYFFQAEDGIRDFHVTGVQTCALPILSPAHRRALQRREPTAGDQPDLAWTQGAGQGTQRAGAGALAAIARAGAAYGRPEAPADRSEERRGGEEGRSRWTTVG